MKRKQILHMILPLFFLIPAVVHGLALDGRSVETELSHQAPIEQLVFIHAVRQEASICLSIRPALLRGLDAKNAVLYQPDESAPEQTYYLSRDAQIYLPFEGLGEDGFALSPIDFPDAYLALIQSNTPPIFLMANRDDTIYRLEYVQFAREPQNPIKGK